MWQRAREADLLNRCITKHEEYNFKAQWGFWWTEEIKQLKTFDMRTVILFTWIHETSKDHHDFNILPHIYLQLFTVLILSEQQCMKNVLLNIEWTAPASCHLHLTVWSNDVQ